MISVQILDDNQLAGTLVYDTEKYIFTYDKNTTAISLTLPKQKEPFISNTLHS